MITPLNELEDGTPFRFMHTAPHNLLNTYIKGRSKRSGRAVFTCLDNGQQFSCNNQRRNCTRLSRCATCTRLYDYDEMAHCNVCHEKEIKRVMELTK